jgi:perosamine synthetase
LEQLPGFLSAKRDLSERYRQVFKGIPGITFFSEPANSQSNYWLNTLLLDEECAVQRDALLAVTNEVGIMTRPSWTLMNTLPMFTASPKMDLSIAESLERRLINIPSSACLETDNAIKLEQV